MAERGLCSRRTADEWIQQGFIWVDGVRVTALGTRIARTAQIKLDPRANEWIAAQKTILLHKPIGYVSGQPEPGYTPAVTLITPENYFASPSHNAAEKITAQTCREYRRDLAPAGRLDLDSSGLLVLTQDGRVARTIIGENSAIEKEYLVRVDRLPDHQGLQKLTFGLALDGKALKPAKVRIQNDAQLMFILREGKKRQIRRMCELVGIRVLGLKRVRIGNIKLGNLPLGCWRLLQAHERFD